MKARQVVLTPEVIDEYIFLVYQEVSFHLDRLNKDSHYHSKTLTDFVRDFDVLSIDTLPQEMPNLMAMIDELNYQSEIESWSAKPKSISILQALYPFLEALISSKIRGKITDDNNIVNTVQSLVDLTDEGEFRRSCRGFISYFNLASAQSKEDSLISILDECIQKAFIEDARFMRAIQYKSLTESEYVLLVMNFLQRTGFVDPSDLRRIGNFYLNLAYEIAIQHLGNLIRDASEDLNKKFGLGLVQYLEYKQYHLAKVVSEENYTRRYFETRLAINFLELGASIESIHRVISFFNGSPITNLPPRKLADAVVDLVSEDRNAKIERRFKDLTSVSRGNQGVYESYDRAYKPGFFPANDPRHRSSPNVTIFSRNEGVMRSVQLNFPTELSQQLLLNRVVDKSFPDRKSARSYAVDRVRAAYAASVSGHSFYLMAMMEFYAKNSLKVARKANPKEVESDISNFIKAFVAGNILKGYHGYHEMVDVIEEQLFVFQPFGLQLNLNWSSAALEKSLEEAGRYAEALSLKGRIHEELSEKKYTLKENQNTGVDVRSVATRLESLPSGGRNKSHFWSSRSQNTKPRSANLSNPKNSPSIVRRKRNK